MLESPFQYGKLAAGSTFVNRVREKQELKSNLYSGINTMLISPRRWGKSSLVKEAMKELVEERPDVRVCFLDVFTVRSEEEFYQLFAKEVIKATSNSWETWISNATEFLKTLSPKISIGVDPMTDFSIGLEYHRVKENERELLELPEKIVNIARCKNPRCITSVEQEIDHVFKLTDREHQVYRCIYCESKLKK